MRLAILNGIQTKFQYTVENLGRPLRTSSVLIFVRRRYAAKNIRSMVQSYQVQPM